MHHAGNTNCKYFAYMIPYTDIKMTIKKMTSNGALPLRRETVVSLEEEQNTLSKSIILCKVSVTPITQRTEKLEDSEYTNFTSNQSQQIQDYDRTIIFGKHSNQPVSDDKSSAARTEINVVATYIHNFEYLYIPIGSGFQFKTLATINVLNTDDSASNAERTLASMGYICNEFVFSQTISRKYDLYDLTDSIEIQRHVTQGSPLYTFLQGFTLTNDKIENVWNSCFAYGACGRTNMSSHTNNALATQDIMMNSLFDFAFENYDRFANNIANGNLFSRYYGIVTDDTINVISFLGSVPAYRNVVSFYHKNDIENIKFTDIIGNLVARQFKLPAGQFHTDFRHITDRHYFPVDYKNSKPDEDHSLFQLVACMMINSLAENMDYPILPFDFQIGYIDTEKQISARRRDGSALVTNRKETYLAYKISIHNEFINRIINTDGSIKQTVKSLAKFINPENAIKLSNISHTSNMVSLFDTTEHGAYWPIKDYVEFDSVKKCIKTALFSYQQRNVAWMESVEKSVGKNKNTLEFKHLGLFEHLLDKQQEIQQASIVEFNIGDNHYNTIMLRTGTNIPIPKKVKPIVELTGGVLADDVGLGKTLSVISHLVNQHGSDKADYLTSAFDCNTLVIIPPRLLKQWIYEIEKYTPAGMFNIIGLASITDVKKYAISKQAEFAAATNTATNTATTTASASTTSTAIRCDTDINIDGTHSEINTSRSDDDSFISRGPFLVPNNLKADYKVLITQLIEDSGVLNGIVKVTTVKRNGTVETTKEDMSNGTNEPRLTTSAGSTISDSTKPTSTRSAAKKMDIVIMSANLLANANYREYVVSAYNANGKQTEYDFHTADYVDIFRMKWNRIIVDEAHERIQVETGNTLDMDTKAISFSIMHLLQSRFRWAMTATPFEHGYSNLLGYLLWLMPSAKIDINSFSTARLNELYTANSSFATQMNEIDIMHANVKYLFHENDSELLQRHILSKTSKRSVAAEINIPIFTEEVHKVQLGTIERNIYNNAKTDNNYRGDKLRRLFELCTNICISTEDIQNLGIDPNKIMSLEELNQAMIGNFGKQLDVIMVELADAYRELPLCERKKDVAAKIQTNLRGLEPRLGQKNLSLNNQLRHFVESAFAHEDNNSYSDMDTGDKRVLKKLRKELYSRLLECEAFSEMIIGITIEIMDGFGTDRPAWDEYRILFIIDFMLGTFSSRSDRQQKTIEENIAKLEREKVRLTNQIKLFESNDFIKEKTADPCSICWTDYTEDSRIAVTHCRHVYCGDCFGAMSTNKTSISCPECRADVVVKATNITTMRDLLGENKPGPVVTELVETATVPEWKTECISKYGTKMATLIEILKDLFTACGNRVIIFSQYDMMLKLIGRTLDEYGIKSVYARGNVRVVNKNIDTFKRDETIRVIMLSSEHSNSGSNLTEASHIILVDVLNMSGEQSKQVETQAIGRAVRLGQRKPVRVVRLITQETIESETYEKNKYDIMSIQ